MIDYAKRGDLKSSGSPPLFSCQTLLIFFLARISCCQLIDNDWILKNSIIEYQTDQRRSTASNIAGIPRKHLWMTSPLQSPPKLYAGAALCMARYSRPG
ncbi:MAG: hypothetical protein WA137_10630 [Methanothrix sp.]